MTGVTEGLCGGRTGELRRSMSRKEQDQHRIVNDTELKIPRFFLSILMMIIVIAALAFPSCP